MKNKKFEFIRLIDHALEIAEQMRERNQAQAAPLKNLIGALQAIKKQVMTDQLEPSQGILTLGWF